MAHNASTNGQRDAHFHTYLQSLVHRQSACAPSMDHTCGLHAFVPTAGSISSLHFAATAHNVHRWRHPYTFCSVCAHSASTTCDGATGAHTTSDHLSAPCWRLPSTTHRHTVPLGLPSCPVESSTAQAEGDVEEFVRLGSPPTVESNITTSAICGAWTLSDEVPQENLLT